MSIEPSEIYDRMVAAGVEISHHESDLYVPDNEITRGIISEYQSKESVTRFRNQRTGTLWFDIPFGYKPFWDKRASKN